MSNKKLIIFFGPSCMGKTTVVKAISENSADFNFFDYDSILYQNTIYFLSKHTNYRLLEKILGVSLIHSLYYGLSTPLISLLRKNYTVLDELEKEAKELSIFLNRNKKMIALKSINDFIEKVKKAYYKNKKIVVDLGCGINSLISLRKLDPTLILLYSPFSCLLERIEKRNLQATQNGPLNPDFLTWRSPLPVYRHFSEFFGSQKIPEDSQYLGTLDKSDVVFAVNKIYKKYPDHLPKNFINIGTFRESLLNEFGFHENESIRLYPRHDSSYVLDTYMPDQSNILKKLHKFGF